MYGLGRKMNEFVAATKWDHSQVNREQEIPNL